MPVNKLQGTGQRKRGGALLFSLIVVISVAMVSLGILQITNSLSRRQKHSVEDKRAFYVAEAGLAEAYYSLGTGGNGQVGAITAPVTLGGGLVWVDAVTEEDGNVRLTSTGLHGGGRSTLEIIVEQTQEPFGVFSDGPIEISEPVLIDGYDSGDSPYYDQVSDGSITIDPTYPYLHDDTGNNILFYEELFYRYQRVEGDTYYFDAVLDHRAHPELDIDDDDFVDDWCGLFCGDFDDYEYKLVINYFHSIPETYELAPVDSDDWVSVQSSEGSGWSGWSSPTPTVASGPTTGGGGLMGSNGSISLNDPGGEGVSVYGDLSPGPEENVDMDPSVIHTGDILTRTEPLELVPVRVPEVELLPGFVHDSPVVRILPPADIGYESIEVRGDSQVTVQGPGTLVLGDFTLLEGATLLVENDAGAVNIYVLSSVDFAEGSRIDVTNQDPSELSLQVSGPNRDVTLAADSFFHGMVYAPESEVFVGTDFEIFGSLAAGALTLAPNVRLHFDSGILGDSGAVPLPKLVGWKIEEVPDAVKQRTNPYKLLDLNEEDLQALGETTESDSWLVEVDLLSLWWWKEGEYEGPIEDFAMSSYRAKIVSFTPPDAGAEDWYINARWKNSWGWTDTYQGPVSGLGKIEMTAIYEWDVIGPGEEQP